MDELPKNLRPELLLRHAAWLRRLAGTLVVDAARADDVAQETLFHALERPPENVASPRAWLATAARNLARSFGRGERRREEHERRAAADVRLPATDEVVARTALHHEIVGAVLALAEPYRTTVLLRFFEEQKPGAIARRMTVPVETVRTRLKRGVELLRGELVRRRADAIRTTSGPARVERPGEWAVALVGLLDSGLRHSVRRALLAKVAGAGAAASVLGGSIGSSAVGVVVMSLQTKIVAVALVIVAGTIAIVGLRERAKPSAVHAGARAPKSPSDLADAARAGAPVETAPVRTSMEPNVSRKNVRGRVVDDAGGSIRGARVGFLPPANDERSGTRDAPPFQLTDAVESGANGEFTLPISDATAIVDIAATATGLVPAVWQRARADDDVTLRLSPAVEFSGVVRDMSGAPVGGARIRWTLHGRWQFSDETTSGRDGSYRFADPMPMSMSFGEDDGASVWLFSSADGFAAIDLHSLEGLKTIDEHHAKFDFWLVRGATVRGRVVGLDDGAPIAGADVWLRMFDLRATLAPLRTKSAGDGSFVLEHVPAWGVTAVGQEGPDLSRRRLGELCASAIGRGVTAQPLNAPDDGAELHFEFNLPRVGGVRGRVVDPAGRGVAGASFFAEKGVGISDWYRVDLGGPDPASRLTDATGRYELGNLSLVDGPGTIAHLTGRTNWATEAWHYSVPTLDVRLIADQIVDVPDVVATRLPGNLVHVVDEHGRDVAGALVIKWARTEDGLRPDDLNPKTGNTGRCFLPVPSDAAGLRRDVFISATATGFAGARVDVASETADVTMALQAEHRLHGTVHDADGRPGFADVLVLPAAEAPGDLVEQLRSCEYWNTNHTELGVRGGTITAGRFVVRGAGPGPWRVVASRFHRDTKRCDVTNVVEVADESKEIDFVLKGSAEPEPPWGEPAPPPEECGKVELTLTFADTGRPVLHAGNVWLRSGKRDLSARAIAPGRYQFEGVGAGPCMMWIDVRGAARETRSVAVVAGQTTSVAVAITSGAIARGRIKLADLPPFKSAGVLLESDDGGGSANSEIGSDGSFAAPGLVAGKTYRMWAWLQESDEQSGLWIADEPARSAADSADWTPHLVPAGDIVARFRDHDHFPDRVAINVYDSAGRLVYTRAPVSEWGIERVVPVGDYVVKIDVPGLETQEQSVAVRQHERATELYFKAR